MVSSRGSGVGAAWGALIDGTPAGSMWQPEGAADRVWAAPIPDDYTANRDIPRNLVHFLDRGSLIALDAALQAVADAGLAPGSGDARRFAVCDGLPYRAPGQPVIFVPYGQLVARALGARGPVLSVSGAEASGLVAVTTAARIVERGEADVVIAGAGQALQPALCDHLRAQGFAARAAARPFDANAAGYVMAEGAAYFVVEDEVHARERGAAVAGRIAGIGHTFDTTAEPLAASDPAEAGRAMQAALGDAGFLQNQVDLFVAPAGGHGPADYAAGMAAMRTFGRHAYYAGVTTVAGSLGFALAASGPLSLAFALEAIRRGETFPIAGLETPEAGLELAFVRERKTETTSCVLVTSMGLGGTNLALVLQR